MSVIYKRSERERDWETSSSRGGGGGGGGGGGYTTVRRYKIPDHSLEEDTYEAEMKLVHRGRNDFDDRRSTRDFDDRRSTKDFDDRRSTKDYAVERDDEQIREVRQYRYVDRSIERSPSPRGRDMHEYRIQPEYNRSPSPSTVEEIRISRDYELDREVTRGRERPYDLEHYSRSTEYFRQDPPLPPPQVQQSGPIIIRNEAPHMPPAPQPIIIREEAPQTIIIREREREPSYELVERKEVIEDRQVARRRHDDDYYYERKVKAVDRGGRHEDRYVEEREYGHDRHGDRTYYSDDDVVYIHKEKDTWGGSDVHAKRDIAAGAIAGITAGQIVRHHRKRKGEAAGGSIGNALGYGTLGAVSAVCLG